MRTTAQRFPRSIMKHGKLILVVVAAFALLIAWRSSYFLGVWRPVEIFGHSMVPALHGVHLRPTCGDCRYSFVVASTEETTLVCPNCGATCPTKKASVRPADRVTIDRLPLRFRQPARWELVAFPDPTDPNRLVVKRFVGGGLERIEIRNGDVYVNGTVLSKSLDQLKKMAVLVHDDRFRPRSTRQISRWQPEHRDAWLTDKNGSWSFASRDTADSPQWLTYRHWACAEVVGSSRQEMPISDQYCVNQGVSRQLQWATDLMLTGQVSAGGSGQLHISIHDTRADHVLRWDFQRQRVVLLQSGKSLREFAVWEKGGQLEFAVCDRRLLLRIGRQKFPPVELPKVAAPQRPTARPISIAATGATGLVIKKLQIWRDLHYLNQFGENRWDFGAGSADRIVVLGDNVPISLDSRHWETDLQRSSLIGKVMKRTANEHGAASITDKR